MIDETYLQILCAHLAQNVPAGGRWTNHASQWGKPKGTPGSGHFLNVNPIVLYAAARDAELPLPDDHEGEQQIIHDNALAVVLAAHAVGSRHGKGHQAGSATVAEVLAEARPDSMKVTLEQLLASKADGFRRLLAQSGCTAAWMDLRTIAAIAYTTTHQGGVVRLQSNPTGRWPQAGGPWEPMITFARATWAAHTAATTA
ncbi:hypothetical protein [Streptomyces sp. NPDC050485]|uniref:hypothetical protein n=1 Tax=Streptomyces sp. NPDC050485 TaxID=3365617 RepID=UPI00379263DD